MMSGADLVAIRLPDGAAFAAALDAAWEAGEAVLPVRPNLPGPEVRSILGELRPCRLVVLVRSKLSGVPPVVHPGFDPAAIARDHDANVVSLVPTMLRRLLQAGVDLRRFRWILLGGGSVPPDLVAEAARAGARVVTTYGMTETCGGAVYDGVPLPGVRVAVGDDGEIALAGPVLMAGYRLRP